MGTGGQVYLLRAGGEPIAEGDDETAWVTPKPAEEAIVDELVEATDDDPEAFDALSSYVDVAELKAVLDPGTETEDMVTFDVEGYEVTVHESGDVEVVT